MQSRPEIAEEEDGGPEERAEHRGFPVPSPQQQAAWPGAELPEHLETTFRLWFDRTSPNSLPLRIEFQPKSYLRLVFGAVPAEDTTVVKSFTDAIPGAQTGEASITRAAFRRPGAEMQVRPSPGALADPELASRSKALAPR